MMRSVYNSRRVNKIAEGGMGLIFKHKSKYIFKKKGFLKKCIPRWSCHYKMNGAPLFFCVCLMMWCVSHDYAANKPLQTKDDILIYLFFIFLGSFQCCTSTTGKHLNFTSILVANCTFKKICIWYAALNFVWNFFFLSLLFDRARLGSIQWRRRMYTHRFLFINVVFLFIF